MKKKLKVEDPEDGNKKMTRKMPVKNPDACSTAKVREF